MKISQTELLRIQREQAIERTWWSHKRRFLNDTALAAAVGRGELVVVPHAQWYRISAHVPEKYHLLAPLALRLLDEISTLWARQMWSAKIKAGGIFLVVSSLTRPTKYQGQLVKQGFPGSSDSSHERGLAFDISYEWFVESGTKEPLNVLWDVLSFGKETGMLNYIEEPSTKVFHVAPSPEFLSNSLL